MIKGKSVTLKLVHEKDLETLHALHSDIANRGEYFPLTIIPEPLFKSKFRETGLWSDDFSQMLILDKQQHIVGSIWAMKAVPYFKAVEIGYIIYDPSHYGQGYMTEALGLFVDYLFKIRSDLNRMEIRVIPGHDASEKVARKCGFVHEADIRQAFFHQGKYQDLKQFALLRHDPSTLPR